jgi:UDP-glucose 4-epimerase
VQPPGTVLVTGAAGLIGSATARLLLERGCRVVACDDLSRGTWQEDRDGLAWAHGDVSDPDLLRSLEGRGVEAVVHCAAHPGGRSLQEPSDDVRVNALGSMRVFEWCARSEVPVVYLSSSAVYGEQPPVPIPETAELRQGTVYAACKVACEQFLSILEAGYGLRWTTLRLFATYGAGHRPGLEQGIVNVMLTQLLAGDRVVVKGSLGRVRDLLYVDDAAGAIVHCLSDPAARGHVLNVGTGVETTIGDLIDQLCEALGRSRDEVSIEEAAGTVGDPLYSVADVGRIAELGWRAEVGVREGIERLVSERAATTPGAA